MHAHKHITTTIRRYFLIIEKIKMPYFSGNIGQEYIFYSNATHISYISVNGGESTTFAVVESATMGYDELRYRFWYYDTVNINLHHANLDGSDSQTVADVVSTFGRFTVDAMNQTIYYIKSDDRSIESIDFNGNTLPDVVGLQSSSDFQDLKIDRYNR